MYKIAVIGDYDSIYGFSAIGFDTYPVNNPGEAREQLEKLLDGGYAVIYITEKLYGELEASMEEYISMPLPAIIQIPGLVGNTGRGMLGVKKTVVKAVGSDIVFK